LNVLQQPASLQCSRTELMTAAGPGFCPPFCPPTAPAF